MAASRLGRVGSSSRSRAELFAGKWVLESVLGHGGMGMVYAARHARLGHRVALKVLSEELRQHPELVTRFEREARAASALTSPHVVRVFDIDTTADGTPFLVMELLEGLDLARLLEREGAQPVGRAVRWVLDACDAIAEAHRRGIVHRDLKPSNLFLAREAERVVLKVLDFGIAKRLAGRDVALTGDVAPLGTPHYMSPEQVRCAKDVDARTDVWSLGVTLFELLTGETPYAQAEASACIAAIAADPVRDPRVLRPELAEALVDVIMRALAKDPRARYEDAEALRQALAPFAELDPELENSAIVRRGTGAAKPRLALHVTTVTGDGVAEPPSERGEVAPVVGPDMLGPARPMRPALRSSETVPPASFEGRLLTTTRGRRVRSVAVAVASACAIAATLLVPKCVGRKAALAGGAANATMIANVPAVAPAPAEAAPVVAPEAETAVAHVTVGDADEVRAKPIATAIPAERPAATAKTTKTPPPSRPAASVKATTAAAAHATPVHGGLRGPGF